MPFVRLTREVSDENVSFALFGKACTNAETRRKKRCVRDEARQPKLTALGQRSLQAHFPPPSRSPRRSRSRPTETSVPKRPAPSSSALPPPLPFLLALVSLPVPSRLVPRARNPSNTSHRSMPSPTDLILRLEFAKFIHTPPRGSRILKGKGGAATCRGRWCWAW